MKFTGKRAPVIAFITFICLALMGLALVNQLVLAQTPTTDDGSVRVAGITPTPTSPAPTPTTPGTPTSAGAGVSIPEPTSIVLMGLGLAGLAGYVKRRRGQ